jgi:hypothetical protein
MTIRIRDQHSATGETQRRKRRLLSGLNFVVVVSLVGIVGFAFPEPVLAGEADPTATITVEVDNYSQASPAVLAGAEREAGRIFGEAGLRTVWLECPVGPSTADRQEACERAIEATDIRLRIVGAPIQNKLPDSVFGFAVHPALATVYYEYAVRRARSDNAEFEAPIILGCVIAHEIGHLLLGSNSHFGTGIMQPRWEPYQVRQLMTGALLFTPEQSKLIRAQARTRMGPQTATLREQRLTRVDQQAGLRSHSAK